MRELKKYALKSELPQSYKLAKPGRAVLEVLRTGAKTAKELCAALPGYKPNTIDGALAQLRKAGMLCE
jgi:hypothetical protein